MTGTSARAQLSAVVRHAVATLKPSIVEVVTPPVRLAEAAVPDVKAAYPTLRRQYRQIIYGAVSGYLESGGSITRWKNLAGRAVLDYFAKAFYRGYTDAGGSETDADDEQWLTDRGNRELAFVAELFTGLKAKRAAGADAAAEANARADGYAATLDGVYNDGKLRGNRNKTLEFAGDDGAESCATCRKLKGKRRTVKWILKHDMIPRPGNAAFECNGFKCEHYWKDPKTGKRYTF